MDLRAFTYVGKGTHIASAPSFHEYILAKSEERGGRVFLLGAFQFREEFQNEERVKECEDE